MKYCAECGSEYVDAAQSCSDCGSTQFGDAQTVRAKGIPLAGERDTRRFARAAISEDPLSTDKYVTVLEDADIPVFARPRRGGTVDNITTASATPWWEILVPEEHVARATELLAAAKADLDATAEEAMRAAEEESVAEPGKPG